ncbi:MAG TPA: RNA polymerase sigma-70 factor [Actinomycetota bacterium]|nr:RNA polymerase sigma-70 factor [Actinomycetota bacterium]
MDPEVFEAHRPLLFSVAYRMLGSVAEAEDVVQDVYLRARAAQDVRDAKAFLVTAATRLSIDRLRSARHRRETYVGPWLPEPLVGAVPDASEPVELRESLSLAFLFVLEALTPSERAAFLLREVFSFPYPEVASALGRSEVATRQLVHRARRALDARRPRFAVPKTEQRALLRRFLDACEGGDVDGLAQLLADGAAAYTDGGGEAQAARRPVLGRRRVARFLVKIAARTPAEVKVEIALVNGRPGIVLRAGGDAVAVLDVDASRDGIERVLVVAAPSKLGSVRATEPAPR